MSNVYIPASSAEQWAQFLAEPEKHWRTGFSAKTLAYSWQEAKGFPSEVKSVFASSSQLADASLLLAIPEHQVPLPGGSRPSQTDVWVLARSGQELVSIAVEGKVSEPFGPTLEEWSADRSPGKNARLSFLCKELELPESLPGTLRYQLLHRTASALIEAKRFCASQAVMLVHSFSQSHEWFNDFATFAELFGAEPSVNGINHVGLRSGVNLHLAWVCGNAEYLARES